MTDLYETHYYEDGWDEDSEGNWHYYPITVIEEEV